jgi:ribosomal protein S18 acetylase RimI-like enzyme
VTGSSEAGPRAFAPGDSKQARELIEGTLGGTPYMERALELLSAVARQDPESRARVVVRDGAMTSLSFYGPVAGASGAWRIGLLLFAARVEPQTVGRAMLSAVADDARDAGARLLLAEVPADAVLGRTLSLLRANGFKQEARIPDFFRQGVALLFLRRELERTIP